MQNLPKLSDTPVENLSVQADKKVILRGDLDVNIKEGVIVDPTRLENLLPTISQILDGQVKSILLIGHLGRPEGEPKEEFSLKPLVEFFKSKLGVEIDFVEYQPIDQWFRVQEQILQSTAKITILENLRFWPEEENNDTNFAQQLAYGQDLYVNEAFASSHREHASIVGIPKVIPGVLGPRFVEEVENLSVVFNEPQKPVISIISGLKKDKLDYIDGFKKFSDQILIGGRLPEFIPESNEDPQLMIGKLNPDKEDLTIHTVEHFEEEILKAHTIIIAGPPGYYEDAGHRLGTQRILNAIANNVDAYKIAGGGDTAAAIKTFNLEKSFNWISSGGGASLEFLAKGTLPGIIALTS